MEDIAQKYAQSAGVHYFLRQGKDDPCTKIITSLLCTRLLEKSNKSGNSIYLSKRGSIKAD